MSEPFVGEIRMFGGNFAPRGWAFCDGQLLAVSQNDALFSLLGTIYGGDGRTTFGLPDMRGRVPIHAGSGPGLSSRRLGSKSGQESVTLTTSQIPSHQALQGAEVQTKQIPPPNPNQPAQNAYLASNQAEPFGGSRAHTNLQPFCCVNFIIALFGIYPSRH